MVYKIFYQLLAVTIRHKWVVSLIHYKANIYTNNFGSTGYFLFRGAPDLIIRSSTSRSYAVIATRPSHGEDMSSEDESVEVARERPSIDPNTQMPIKMGELIAQLHF